MNSKLKLSKEILKRRQIDQNIESLRKVLDESYPTLEYHPNVWFLMETQKSRESLADVIDRITEAACLAVDPYIGYSFFTLSKIDWRNIQYNPKVGLVLKDQEVLITCRATRKRLTRLIILMKRISYFLRSNIYQTKRKLYYSDKDNYGKSQQYLDGLIESIAASLRIPRLMLHIVAQSKGLVCGKMTLIASENDEDTTNGGPSERRIISEKQMADTHASMIVDTANIIEIKSDTKFCLVIEKDAVFHDLVSAKVQKKFNCILVTGKGIPDTGTRHLVHLIWQFLRIPILCLTDGDPHGIEIMCVYRYGAVSTAYDNKNLAVPSMRWLGVFPSDLMDKKFKECFECIDTEHNYSSSSSDIDEPPTKDEMRFVKPHIQKQAYIRGLEKLSERDIDLLLRMQRRPYVNEGDDLYNEIQLMLALNVKIGLETLSEIEHSFLWDWYLPMKLQNNIFV